MASAVARRERNRFAERANYNGSLNTLMRNRPDELPANSWGPEDLKLKRGKGPNRATQMFEDADPAFAPKSLPERMTPSVELAAGRVVGIENGDDLQSLIDEVATATNGLSSTGTRCSASIYALHRAYNLFTV